MEILDQATVTSHLDYCLQPPDMLLSLQFQPLPMHPLCSPHSILS